ncbi:MAG: ATP-binding protein [Gammaproteobacteria bacterium]|nr:ATP-binding protein [Gammaproteobacteria bacterium]
MSLLEKINIAGRFLRSVRIDEDNPADSLEGYVFPASLKNLILGMAVQQSETKQGAFTWTGPYGGGKSSLALAMTALLSGDAKSRAKAAAVAGNSFSESLWSLLPPNKNGWTCVPVVGHRGNPQEAIHRAVSKVAKLRSVDPNNPISVVDEIRSAAESKGKSGGGIIIFIDEMGKFLEEAALSGHDVYFFQLLAEAASRSEGKLLVVGILHQAFHAYAGKLASDVKDEWSKIQGRFADVPVNISGEEQIELISRAIVCTHVDSASTKLATDTVVQVQKTRPNFGTGNNKALAGAWPLNPLTTLLLGPISRRAYGQNQRSIFSFLSSAERFGFQDFLRHAADEKSTYQIPHLWDYLIFNLESSISASSDSHHFIATKDAIERCSAQGCDDLAIDLLKTVSLLEMTRRLTGVGASLEALCLALPNQEKDAIEHAIRVLETHSAIIFRRFRDSYAIFEGSDFDIEEATIEASRTIHDIDLGAIASAVATPVIAAKRHYHETGNMRWCDFVVVPVDQLKDAAIQHSKKSGAFGLVALTIPTAGETYKDTQTAIDEVQAGWPSFDFIAVASKEKNSLAIYAKDRAVLVHLLEDNQELANDQIARREIRERIEALDLKIEQDVWLILTSSFWHIAGAKPQSLSWQAANSLVSDIADRRFSKAPVLHNELINRSKPSGSANGALKILLRAMVLKEPEENLSFQKYPAERGLYSSLLAANDLHIKSGSTWRLNAPKADDKANLAPAWEAAKIYLKENQSRSVSVEELYRIWTAAPFGIKEGVLPLLAVLFMLTEKAELAYYNRGVFLSRITDVDTDYLMKSPELIQMRWMDISEVARTLLGELADIAAELAGNPVLDLEPIDVARALIAAFDSAPKWVHRTLRLSKNAMQLRSLFKQASDPNKFIFNDIPELYRNETDVTSVEGIKYVASQMRDGLREILDAYPSMLKKMRDQILAELQVHSLSGRAFTELAERAINVKGITGEPRLEAFINRVSLLDDKLESFESLASLAINRQPKDWIDTDLDQAAVALTNLAQAFNRHETVARVKGRKDKRAAIAVVVGMGGRPTPYVREFDILDSEDGTVNALVQQLEAAIASSKEANPNLILAALAQLSATLIEEHDRSVEEKKLA